MMKAILGYDLEPGISPEEYDRWLFEVHCPDLLANPYLDRLVFNTVTGSVGQASGGAMEIPPGETYYRIAELHFADEEAYANYRAWFAEHPIPPERGPAGRTRFRFYLTATTRSVERD